MDLASSDMVELCRHCTNSVIPKRIRRDSFRKGRRNQRIWSFLRKGGSEMDLVSSDVVESSGLEPLTFRV